MMRKKILTLKETFTKKIAVFGDRFQLPEKWKGGRIEKLSLFFQGLYLDYKSVAMDTIQESKVKPRKTFMICSGLGVLLAALKTNPDDHSFQDCQRRCITELAMVGDLIRNPAAEDHIAYLTRTQNQGLLRRIDLLFASLIWEADYDKDCKLYASQCKYLQPKFLTFHKRIVDVGIFGTWINLNWKMQDFDVNPAEWVDET